MNPRLSTHKIDWYPEALAGTIATVEPTLHIIFEGAYWRGALLKPVAQMPTPGQICRVLGRQGLTLLIQLSDSAIVN